MSVEPGTAEDAQRAHNAHVWRRGGLVAGYADGVLRGAEAALLERHGGALAGDVLELGCGAGRITGHLAARARTLLGIDIAADMVAHCTLLIPSARFEVGDIRDLRGLGSGCFDAVVAGTL